MKILVVTSCGRRKATVPQPAWKLYKSPRIRAVYNRRNGHDMAILSSKYGLIDAEIQPYEAILTKERAEELLPQVIEKIQNYDFEVYYRGGAGSKYFNLIKDACIKSQKDFGSLGYKNLGDINRINEVLHGQMESMRVRLQRRII